MYCGLDAFCHEFSYFMAVTLQLMILVEKSNDLISYNGFFGLVSIIILITLYVINILKLRIANNYFLKKLLFLNRIILVFYHSIYILYFSKLVLKVLGI